MKDEDVKFIAECLCDYMRLGSISPKAFDRLQAIAEGKT